MSYLHNLCRFGDTNEWSNEPPEPGWASPLTVSGLTRVGRGERLVRASVAAATVTYSIRSSAGCQRFLVANRWIGNRRAVTTIMRGDLVATSQHVGQHVARRTDVAAVPEPGTTATAIASLSVVAACCHCANCVHDRPVATRSINHFPGGQLAF